MRLNLGLQHTCVHIMALAAWTHIMALAAWTPYPAAAEPPANAPMPASGCERGSPLAGYPDHVEDRLSKRPA